MATPRRTRRPRTTLLILVLASVTIITLDARGGFHRITSGLRTVAADAFAPVRSGVDDLVEPVGSFLAGAVHYGSVRQQNQKLQAEIDQLRNQRVAQTDIDARLKQLSALAHLPFVGNDETVAAEVTNYGTSDFAATVDISVGRDDGVQLNMPVVGMGGLVGQVVQANHTTSTVRLITDGQSQVGARLGPGANSLAVISGHGPGRPLSAGLVPTDTALAVGEHFVTSGLPNAEFPGDIPVATVVSTDNGGPRPSEETVARAPSADLSHLRYVSVLLYGPPT